MTRSPSAEFPGRAQSRVRSDTRPTSLSSRLQSMVPDVDSRRSPTPDKEPSSSDEDDRARTIEDMPIAAANAALRKRRVISSRRASFREAGSEGDISASTGCSTPDIRRTDVPPIPLSSLAAVASARRAHRSLEAKQLACNTSALETWVHPTTAAAVEASPSYTEIRARKQAKRRSKQLRLDQARRRSRSRSRSFKDGLHSSNTIFTPLPQPDVLTPETPFSPPTAPELPLKPPHSTLGGSSPPVHHRSTHSINHVPPSTLYLHNLIEPQRRSRSNSAPAELTRFLGRPPSSPKHCPSCDIRPRAQDSDDHGQCSSRPLETSDGSNKDESADSPFPILVEDEPSHSRQLCESPSTLPVLLAVTSGPEWGQATPISHENATPMGVEQTAVDSRSDDDDDCVVYRMDDRADPRRQETIRASQRMPPPGQYSYSSRRTLLSKYELQNH